MSEKRFVYGVIKGSRQAHIKDCHNCKSATIDVYDDNIKYFVDLLNEQQATIDKQELRLQCIEELLELSENLNKSYREKLIDMNLKMVIDDE